MAQYRTDQERIDAATLEIKNPNVVGSGYIQHPAQKPFAAPLQMQPPTVAHFEFPDEYSTYREHTRHPAGGQAPPRRSHDQRSQGYAQANGRLQNGPASYSNSSGQQGGYRQPHAPPGRPQQQGSAGKGAPRPAGPRPARVAPIAAAPQPQARQAAIPVVPPRAPHQAAPSQRPHAHSAAQQQCAPAAAAPPQQRPSAPAAQGPHSAPMADGQSAAALSQSGAGLSLGEGGTKQAAETPTQPENAGNAAEQTEEERDKMMSKSQAKRLRKKKREGKL